MAGHAAVGVGAVAVGGVAARGAQRWQRGGDGGRGAQGCSGRGGAVNVTIFRGSLAARGERGGTALAFSCGCCCCYFVIYPGRRSFGLIFEVYW